MTSRDLSGRSDGSDEQNMPRGSKLHSRVGSCRARGKRRGVSPRAAARHRSQTRVPQILSFFLMIKFGWVSFSPSVFYFFWDRTWLKSDRWLNWRNTPLELSMFIVRSQIFQKNHVGHVRFQKNSRKRDQKVELRSVGTVFRLLWRAAAAGLKPLRLPRAPRGFLP